MSGGGPDRPDGGREGRSGRNEPGADGSLLRDLLRESSRRLAFAGVDTPEHDAKLLLAEAAGVELRDVDRAMLLGEAVPFDRVRFDAMIRRRAAREPLQYIVGHAPFRWLELQVGPGVFIPRPETETVVQTGLDWLSSHAVASPRVVDLCAGSGAIGLSVATELPAAEVWAVELSDEAMTWTRRNAQAVLGHDWRNGRFHLTQADATDAGTLAELDGTIDAVITNPPYVPLDDIPEQPEVREHDPELALYGGSADGLRIPERIIARAAALLRSGGLLVMEHDVTQGAALAETAKAAGFDSARTGQDLTGRNRYLVALNA